VNVDACTISWAKKPGSQGKGPFKITEIIVDESGFFGENVLSIITSDEPLIVRFESASECTRWRHACLAVVKGGERDAATFGADGDTTAP
jgi:hypothetical protein